MFNLDPSQLFFLVVFYLRFRFVEDAKKKLSLVDHSPDECTDEEEGKYSRWAFYLSRTPKMWLTGLVTDRLRVSSFVSFAGPLLVLRYELSSTDCLIFSSPLETREDVDWPLPLPISGSPLHLLQVLRLRKNARKGKYTEPPQALEGFRRDQGYLSSNFKLSR